MTHISGGILPPLRVEFFPLEPNLHEVSQSLYVHGRHFSHFTSLLKRRTEKKNSKQTNFIVLTFMQTQSDSGNDKATRTQDRKASITPQPFMPFDPFSVKKKHIATTVLYCRCFLFIPSLTTVKTIVKNSYYKNSR